ncbi:DUF5133 domain-containing protein [Streptomyces sp. NPDC006134]|uniref:DUF5133 domain-containing protein n=1 Tax=Streptomyces sp. NPDC006134 TaxID=3154467 RepID=UPI00340AA927
MLVPDPKAVRELLTRYASLQIARAERVTPGVARELEDVCYTLCVTMGTTDIHEAVAKADALLLGGERNPVTAETAAEQDGESGLPLAV